MRYPVRTLLRPSQKSPKLPPGVAVEAAVCSLHDERGLRAAMKDVDVVFHLAGTERQGTRADLNGVDVEGTRTIVEAARQSNVKRIITLSHLGADRASAYAVLKAKALAESALLHGQVPYTIVRSAAVFGPGDQFTQGLTALLRLSPGIFLLPAGGTSLLQPLWVEDLVTVLLMTMEDENFANQTLSIGGSETLTFRQVVQTLLQVTGTRRLLLNASFPSIRGMALWLEQGGRFPLSIYWLDYLAADRTCPVDVLPREFGLMPARFHKELGYLKK